MEPLVQRFLKDQRNEIRCPALDRVGLPGGMARRRPARGIARLRRAAVDKRGIGRFGQDDPGFRPRLPDDAANPGHGPPGAVSRNDVVQSLALEIGKDLARGRGLVDVGVVLGLELPGQEPAVLLGQLHRLAVHAHRLVRARRQHDPGPQHPHQPPAFDGKAVRHRHDQRIALGRANHCKPDSGIARCRLHDRLPGLQPAFTFGGLDDVDREPVLDRCAGVEGLDLDIDCHMIRCDPVDAHDRRIADGVQNTVIAAAAPGRCPDRCGHGVSFLLAATGYAKPARKETPRNRPRSGARKNLPCPPERLEKCRPRVVRTVRQRRDHLFGPDQIGGPALHRPVKRRRLGDGPDVRHLVADLQERRPADFLGAFAT